MGRIDNAFHDTMLLDESLLFEAFSLADVQQKYYPNIDPEIFSEIVGADPTSGADKMGKYSKWLLWLYQKNNLKLEDLYKAKEYLTTFDKFKNKIPNGNDIGKYQSLPQLYKAIQPFEGQKTHGEEIREIKEGAEKVYEDGTWLVVVPHTKEAAIYYGKNTKWCTASTENHNMFDQYNEQGKLYININKNTNKKYQFHFETCQFMDEIDEEISTPIKETIGITNGLLQYYLNTHGVNALFYLTMEEPFNYKSLDTYNPSFVDEDAVYTYNGNGFSFQACPGGIKGSFYTTFGEIAIDYRYIPLYSENYKKVLNLYDTQTFSWAFPLDEVSHVEANQPYATYLQNSSFLCVVFENGTRTIFDVHNAKFIGEVSTDIIDIKPINIYKKTKKYSKNLAVYTESNSDEGKVMFGIFDMAQGQKLTEPIYLKTFYEPLLLNREGYKFGEENRFLGMKKPHNQTNQYNADYQNSDVLFYDGRIFKLPEFMQIAQRLYDEWLSKHPEQSQGE